ALPRLRLSAEQPRAADTDRVAPGDRRDARRDVAALRTPEHQSGATVEPVCADLPLRPARLADALGGRHVAGEDLLEQPGDRVPVGVHRQAPVGPNRSVRTLRGSWPRSTRSRAASSTNGVGPQT